MTISLHKVIAHRGMFALFRATRKYSTVNGWTPSLPFVSTVYREHLNDCVRKRHWRKIEVDSYYLSLFINSCSFDQRTPLNRLLLTFPPHEGEVRKYLDTFYTLFRHGADPNRADGYNVRPFEILARYKPKNAFEDKLHFRLITELIGYGAEPDWEEDPPKPELGTGSLQNHFLVLNSSDLEE